MLPFDEISSPELGLEDDVLGALPAQQPFPTPRWLRRRPPSPSSPSRTAWSTASSAARALYRAARTLTTTVLLPALTVATAALLRPRPSPRCVLSAGPLLLLLLYAAHRLLAGRPLLASPLPPYAAAGRAPPYDVGAVDVEVALDAPRRVADATFRADGRPAFEVRTVLFTLYYPTPREGGGASSSSSSAPSDVMYWIPKPVSATARGYARFLGADNALVRGALTLGLWLVAGGITIPARVGAPLVPATSVGVGAGDEEEVVGGRNATGTGTGEGRLPVVIFSHGMLSSRTDYTAYLGSLAARGVVVAALEHRDGSSPGTAVLRRRRRSGRDDDGGADDDARFVEDDEAEEWRYAFGLRDLAAPAGAAPLDEAAVKEAQLSFREAEIDAAAAALRGLDSGLLDLARSNPRHPASAPDDLYVSFAGRLDLAGGITLAGHSYGATGVLRALRPRGASPRSSPFAGAVALDPGKSSGPLNADVSVPLVICHSASWSRPGPSLFYGRPHFEVVRDLVEGVNERCGAGAGGGPTAAADADAHLRRRRRRREEEDDVGEDGNPTDPPGACASGARGWFFTSLGTSHPSITDAPLLEPLLLAWTTGSTMDAHQGIRQYVHLTRDFVSYQHTGSRDGLLALSSGGVGGDGESVVSRTFDPSHNDRMPERWRPYWQAHAAPV